MAPKDWVAITDEAEDGFENPDKIYYRIKERQLCWVQLELIFEEEIDRKVSKGCEPLTQRDHYDNSLVPLPPQRYNVLPLLLLLCRELSVVLDLDFFLDLRFNRVLMHDDIMNLSIFRIIIGR